jgi:hypothetical protein
VRVATKLPRVSEPARFFSIANIAYIAYILPKTMSYTFYKKFKPLLTMTDICYTFYKESKPLLTMTDILAFGARPPGRALARPVTETHPPQTFFLIFFGC